MSEKPQAPKAPRVFHNPLPLVYADAFSIAMTPMGCILNLGLGHSEKEAATLEITSRLVLPPEVARNLAQMLFKATTPAPAPAPAPAPVTGKVATAAAPAIPLKSAPPKKK